MKQSVAIIIVLAGLVCSKPLAGAATRCAATPQDEIGPFYKPNAPLRDNIGSGYRLYGTVRSSATCAPLARVRIEFWQAGKNGKYDDAHRAAVITDSKGRYSMTTDLPPPYASRPAHIHMLLDIKNFAGLITQHYPKKGMTQARYDLVLEPE